MTTTTAPAERRKLTPKGEATRARILAHTAELIYRHGVHATNQEQVRKAAQVSGSQLNHYFPTKQDLVLGVIEWQANSVLGLHRGEEFGRFETLDGFRAWAAFYIGYERAFHEGCSLGSLASEIIKTELDVHDELAEAFAQWRGIFRDALSRLQSQGSLSGEADPEQLATLLLAAFQGGMLLAQVAREITPLRDALTAALGYVETFAVTGEAPAATSSSPSDVRQ
jgi:AcrR family transcriptional regulator